MTSAKLVGALLLAHVAHAQDSLPAFQPVSGLTHNVVLSRLPLDARWDLLAALASTGTCEPAPRNCWWNTKDWLGILLADRATSELIPITIEPGPNDDCSVRIERFTAEELVLSCRGEKWSTYDNQKFVYDARSRRLLSHSSYPPFSADQILPGPQLRMIDRSGKSVCVALPGPEPKLAPCVAPAQKTDERFHVDKSGIAVDGGPLVPLPQTDIQTWKRARPDDAKSYNNPEQAQIHEEIGPYQVDGGLLWFAKTFYNGEGDTGLGGFGYFDPAVLSYRLISPPDIADWSVTSMLVEPDAVWLALSHRGEYGDTPGGLLRWDRTSTAIRKFDIRALATAMVRAGDSLYLGTTDGVIAIRGDRISSYFVDRGEDGSYLLVPR